ncbi:MAG: ribosome maturation factor RimM [Chloroflexota bacterium]|nr:ribosome maturation factor RimM [Chloroflexota bacterium]
MQRPPRGRRLIETTGPDPNTPLSEVRLTVGTLVGTHGVDGELKVRLATDDPDHLQYIKQVFVGTEPRARRLHGSRMHGEMALIRLQGVSTPEQGALLRGQPLRIRGSDARPLEPGEYLLYQLIGLDAVDEAGGSLGKVVDLMETGTHDVLVIAPEDGPDLLVPNHPEYVLDVQPTAGRMTVRPPVYDDPPESGPRGL